MATYFRLIVLLAVALVLSVFITHRSVGLLTGYGVERLPKQLASLTGEDLPLTPFEVELLAPDGGQIVQRRYGQGDTVIWLSAVQSRSDWRVQHPPQICYVAQGWVIEEESPQTLRGRNGRACDVRRMVVRKDGERRLVYYFYTDGRHWTASYFSRVMDSFLDRMIHSNTSTWVLIQLSTPFSSGEDELRLSSACLELFQ